MRLLSWINKNTITEQTNFTIALNFTLCNVTSGNGSFVKLVYFANFNSGNFFLFNLWFKHAFHCTLDLFDGVINDGV